MRTWTAMSCAQVIAKLPDSECYQVGFESKRYQVEVQLLADTPKYIQVGLSVDDGSLPASFRPVASSFICDKDGPNKDGPATDQ